MKKILLSLIVLVSSYILLLGLVFVIPSFWLATALSFIIVASVFALILRKKNATPVLGVSLVLFLLPIAYLYISEPLDKPTPKSTPFGMELKYWNLSSGSEIGYIEFTPETLKNAYPILMLHGGAGASSGFEFPFAKKLQQAGYKVYVFDQPGSGWSKNLDLYDYSITRWVEDLELIRKEINTKKIHLIGHSFGGMYTSAYLIKHQQNVEKAILVAPGGYGIKGAWLNDYTKVKNLADFPFDKTEDFFQLETSVRFMLGSLGLQKGIQSGVIEDIFSQDSGKWFVEHKANMQTASAGSHCKGRTPPLNGTEKYANLNLYLSGILNTSKEIITSELKKINTPVLVIRAECDYLAWEVQKPYRDLMQNASLIYVKGVGHNAYASDDSFSNTVEFLQNGKPLFQPYTDDVNPFFKN